MSLRPNWDKQVWLRFLESLNQRQDRKKQKPKPYPHKTTPEEFWERQRDLGNAD